MPDLPFPTESQSDPAVSADSEWLASADSVGCITLMDLTRTRPARFLLGHEGYADLAFTHRQRVLASGGEDMIIRLWDSDAPARDTTIETGIVKIQDLRFLEDSRRFIVAGEASNIAGTNQEQFSSISLWELGQRTAVAVATNLGQPLHQSVSLSSGGHFVVCNDAVGKNRSKADTLRVFSLPGLVPLTNLPGSHLAQSAGGSTIVHAQGNRLLLRRSLHEWPQLVGESTDTIVKVALSPDGRSAATAAEPNTGVLTFWDLSRRQAPVTTRKHERGIHMLAFSPDNRWLASASWDSPVGLWDAPARRWVGALQGHRAPVTCVAFSPDNRTLASGSKDGTVRLWHIRTRGALAVLTPQLGEVWAVAFSPDGQWLLAGGSNGRIQQWRAPSWEEIASARNTKSSTPEPP